MILHRRQLLVAAAGGAFLGLTGMALPGAAAKRRIGAVGLQLYTVRELFAADPVGTLEKVAAVGYREVEFGGGGYEAMDAALLRATLDRVGLKAPSVHVGYDVLRASPDKGIALARTLGADTIVLPYMADEHRSEAAWQAALPEFNRIARAVRAAGLGFAYHNHDFEFTVKPGGVSLWDRFMKEVDPALVGIELDLYWAAFAGQSPKALIEQLGPRLYSFHVKDMAADRGMAAVGRGTIDFAALFRLNGAAGVRHFYVENDRAPAPYIPDITTSFQTLTALRF
jgi:sugar phosphate isomerase/epimerase